MITCQQLVFWISLAAGLFVLSTLSHADELTPIGAIKAGNADGTIPAWTGGLIEPVSVDPQLRQTAGRYADPFVSDKPAFRITPSNYNTYADQLSAGHIKLLQTYPSYFLDVYPTRRTAAYPQAIYDAALANDGKAKLDGDTLTNATLSVPFRQPSTGAEVITNHKLRYRGDTVTRYNNDIIINADGKQWKTLRIERVLFNFSNISQNNPANNDQLVAYSVNKVLAPPKDAGRVILIHEYLHPVSGDKSGLTNNGWRYRPGNYKVRGRAPILAYDYKPLGGDGQYFIDQVDMYFGPMDRYTWQLKGRQAFYIPYNSYKLADKSLTYQEILPGKHLNQTLARYELHRAWVVEATLKNNASHSIAKRTFYVDEDSWGIAMVDVYNKNDGLWRFQEGHAMQFYGRDDVLFTSTTPEIIYDFANGKYLARAISNEETTVQFDNPDFEKKHFQSNYMKKIK